MTSPHSRRIAVVGGGVHGLCTAWALRERGFQVDVFEGDMPRQSSWGETRIFRFAYFESPSYVPLMRQAFGRWQALPGVSGRLGEAVGAVYAGSPHSPVIEGVLAAAAAHDISIRVNSVALDGNPYGFTFPADWIWILESQAGFLRSDLAMRALRRMLEAFRVRFFRREVREWGIQGDDIRVEGIRYDGVVLAPGSYLPELLPAWAPYLRVTEQTAVWATVYDFGPHPNAVFGIDAPNGFLYGFPPLAGPRSELKFGNHVPAEVPVPAEKLVDQLLPYVMGLSGEVSRTMPCAYTNTRDGNFLIDFVGDPRVIAISACSGHGFKFAPAIGQLVSEMIASGQTPDLLRPFALSAHQPYEDRSERA